MTVRCPREGARTADERAGDDACDAKAFHHQPVRNLARPVQFRHRHDLFVRRDLEDAVGRRVHDQRAGPHVLGSEFVDDRCPGGRDVAQDAASRQPGELREHVRREAAREHRERTIEDDTHHLPVAGDRVLPR